MAQLWIFLGVPDRNKRNPSQEIAKSEMKLRGNIRTRSWMADAESAKPIETNTIGARMRGRGKPVFVFTARGPSHVEIDFSDSGTPACGLPSIRRRFALGEPLQF